MDGWSPVSQQDGSSTLAWTAKVPIFNLSGAPGILAKYLAVATVAPIRLECESLSHRSLH